jgi:RiboL-PSP-HEPN
MRGNPNEDNITRLFNSIGFSNVLDGISWQRMSNKQLRLKLRALNELRNKIVHGSSVTVKKSALENYFNVFNSFAEKLDEKLRRDVRTLTGTDPW